MKAKLALLFILVLGFVIFVTVKFFIFDKQNEIGKLKILSSPPASIFIDNVAIGKTPFENNYKTGEYILKLIPEGSATETASWNGKIQVYQNALTYVNRELGTSDINSAGEIFTTTRMKTSPKSGGYGEIDVNTDPQGAIVTLDNDEKGVAPLIMQDVPQGDHELSVYMPGFFRRTQKINVDTGYVVNASFKLAINQTEQAQLSPTPTLDQTATQSAALSGKTVVSINDNPQGWLRVRADASIDASEEAKIKTGGTYEYVDSQDGWYEIKFNGDEKDLVSGSFDTGWVSSEYATKKTE